MLLTKQICLNTAMIEMCTLFYANIGLYGYDESAAA